ncbi:MAG: pyridoxal phosphate-dependent aminotransferase [Kiritimatiellaeota bacterium]|nr:pyridoxal phosphate-dependent aminotransferase [Kiritimatiellota bacterium]
MFEQGLELKKKFGADKVYDFSIGNPDLPTPAKAAEVLRTLADHAADPMAFGYCPNAGLPAVREALAARLATEQCVGVTAQEVIVSVGAAGGLVSFFRSVLEPGDEILVPSPYFLEYRVYVGHFGGVLVPVPMAAPSFALDVAALAAKVTPKTRVILINTPNNPTGVIYSQEQLAELGRLLEKVNAGRERPVFLLSDEPYRLLAYDGITVPPVLPLSPYAVVVGSYSKSLSLAGERVGYVAVNPAMPEVGKMMAALTLMTRALGFVNAPVIGQKLVLSLLDSGVDVAVYDRRRKAMAEVLTAAGLSFAMPQGAFYFFVQAPGGDDAAFTQRLAAENILAVPGGGFGCPGYFRVAFCVDEAIIRNSAPAWRNVAQAL